MRTLMQPFKINLVNTVLVGGEQFAFHMSELLLTFMGFTQLTLWWCFWFAVGYVTGRVEWMVHHFHQLHSNLMWKVSYPIWEFIIIPGSGNPISQSFLVPFQVRPKHHIYFHILPIPCSWDGLWDKDHGKKSGMVWKLARESICASTGQVLSNVHTHWRDRKIRIKLCFSITQK